MDGDVICYAAASVSEFEIDWEDGDGVTKCGSMGRAIQVFKTIVDKHLRDLDTNKFNICWSMGQNFRKSVFPEYKMHRKAKEKPIDYVPLKEWALNHYGDSNLWIEGTEGDDVQGIYATLEPGKHIIVTIDKDLKGIPGLLWRHSPNARFGSKEPTVLQTITPQAAQEFFITQVVMGDKTDGYFGVPGIGPKKAQAWLKENGYTWDSVVRLYESKGLDEAYALQMARCAKILDSRHYDSKTNTVRMWEPSDLLEF